MRKRVDDTHSEDKLGPIFIPKDLTEDNDETLSSLHSIPNEREVPTF